MAPEFCLPASDKTFGPRVDVSCRSFDFTLLFEDVVFASLPVAAFLALIPPHVTFLARRSASCSVRSKLLGSKLTALAGVLITQVVFLALRSQNEDLTTAASSSADVLSVVGTAAAAWLSYMDHQRSLRPSTLLSLYLSALTIVDIARVRTLWLIGNGSRESSVMTATLILTGIALILESIEKKSSLAKDKRAGAPEEYSGVWIRTAFAWLLATFRTGYARIITLDDLPSLDTRLESKVLRAKLAKTWGGYDHQKKHSLLKACMRSYLPSFLSAVIPRLCKTAFSFTQPFLIDTTVSYVGETQPDANYGKGLIGAWALVFLGMATSQAIYQYQNTRWVTRLKGGLIGLVYQETLKARAVDLGETTAIALVGTDIERIGQSVRVAHEVWGCLLDIGIAIWLLVDQVSLAALAPVAIIIIFFAATHPLTRAAKSAQKQWIERVQDRLRVTSSMLDDMKAVKMLGLSRVMSNIVHGLRKTEIETSKRYRKLLVYLILMSNSPINLAPVATFAVYVVMSVYWKSGSLLTAQAFTSITLINLLITPVIIFIQNVPELFKSVGSFERIQEYCNCAPQGTNPDTAVTRMQDGSAIGLEPLSRSTSKPTQGDNKYSVIMESQSFSWGRSKSSVLNDISMDIARGSITILVGAVGSGKSTLLESLLGETFSTQGNPWKGLSSVAYCSQQPWLENGTIRSNIIGVTPYDRDWYSTVKFACNLDQDLQELDKGDRTLVGSKGLNLSGGQKQRIALARAVYSRKNIVFLDDVFSGMDAHTVDAVSRRLLGNDGLFRARSTTVLLATHSHKLMKLADSIIALQDSKIIETGSPDSLLNNGGYVSKLGLHLQEAGDCCDSDRDNVARVSSTTAESTASAEFRDEPDDTAWDTRRKNGDFSVYGYYFASSGYSVVGVSVLFIGTWVFCSEFPTVWLKWWSEANAAEPNANVGMYMGVYVALSLTGLLLACIACWFIFITILANSAYRLHSDLLEATLSFSQDMELIDMNLPMYMVNYITTAFSTIIKGIILLVFSQYLAVTMPFVIAVLYVLQSFYLQTSRQVRLLEIEAKAPLYTHFIESVAGAATIRAFGWQKHYQERNYRFIDSSQRPAYLQYCIQHWLSFVMDMVVTGIAVILLAIVVTWRDKFSAGSVGVSLVMVITFSTNLMRLIQMWTMMESSIGAVARVKRFVNETESEEEKGGQIEVAPNWPQAGQLGFKAVVAAHRPNAEPVMRGVSMEIKPQEHVAICGRSGSGKTSLILALLRMIETQRGQIVVDGVDVANLSCTDVRSHLNVVPQDPFLLPGTIRLNLDPFGTASDEQITCALERVRLWTIVKEQGGLSQVIDTAAWSAGQRQLLCLARAMVRKSNILILDEATSSVDDGTEAVMQEIIDTEFKTCTVLAVMHRLKHIARYDKVALLDKGMLVEYDAPTTLLQQASRFSDLYQSSSK
ncbi:uncharacterized protein JN550_012571 [Neoarthrinium moseri]|uniref:uncharacterized protein n=1 Tax=Neoarthrinium moseri TaxID=1658444 RepID=UPI001FDDFE98|nr:uncharacterized protein JN550_012571 [Neoarthrinium moseri]KAI1858524.1 hypothetical protein JN550_012571 [Neoarthrinium moseri]